MGIWYPLDHSQSAMTLSTVDVKTHQRHQTYQAYNFYMSDMSFFYVRHISGALINTAFWQCQINLVEDL